MLSSGLHFQSAFVDTPNIPSWYLIEYIQSLGVDRQAGRATYVGSPQHPAALRTELDGDAGQMDAIQGSGFGCTSLG